MAKLPNKKPSPAGKPQARPSSSSKKLSASTSESKTLADAKKSFLAGADARGEIAPAGAEPPYAPGVLFTEEKPGQLTRRRFSISGASESTPKPTTGE